MFRPRIRKALGTFQEQQEAREAWGRVGGAGPQPSLQAQAPLRGTLSVCSPAAPPCSLFLWGSPSPFFCPLKFSQSLPGPSHPSCTLVPLFPSNPVTPCVKGWTWEQSLSWLRSSPPTPTPSRSPQKGVEFPFRCRTEPTSVLFMPLQSGSC